MRLPKNPFLRKAIILPLLAMAALLVAEVYQQISTKSPEELLTALGAQQVMTQTMDVNGRSVLADVWRLPDFASSASLNKIKAKVITVGKIVYVFHDDFSSIRGQCDYPTDLPTCNITCNYVIDATHSRFISGVSTLSPNAILSEFSTSATAKGWTSLNQNVWQKDDSTLFIHTSEGQHTTNIVLAIQKELP